MWVCWGKTEGVWMACVVILKDVGTGIIFLCG
jgi:hypothetical protein